MKCIILHEFLKHMPSKASVCKEFVGFRNAYRRYERGGRHQISNFSQIQKSPNHPGGGGGGARKLWTISTFCDIFSLGPFPDVPSMMWCGVCREYKTCR